MSDSVPPPRYTIWQSIAVAIGLSRQAIEEARAARDAPSKFPTVREWSDVVHYEGAVVAYGGTTWQATRDTGREPPHDDWRVLAASGAPGRGFSVRGTFAAEERYSALDVVALAGGSFVALRDDPGPCPGDGWQLFARQGKAGQPGPRGERGPAGPPGPAAASMTLSEDGILTLSLADGQAVSVDFYPLLAQLK